MPKGSSKEKRAVLIFLAKNKAGEMVKLRRDATIIGREKGDIIIKDSEVSSTHCQIQEISGDYHIFDMNSTNGTYVNGERIIKAKLVEEDIIKLGGTSFKFSIQDEKKVRHIPTIFKQSDFEKVKNTSVIETLIESELRNTQYSGIKLFVTYDDGYSEEIELNQQIIYIGRASSFGRFDRDSEISRKHLLIKLNSTGEIFIEDQGSTNGSFLNDKQIKGMHQVAPDDHVRIGNTKIKISASVV